MIRRIVGVVCAAVLVIFFGVVLGSIVTYGVPTEGWWIALAVPVAIVGLALTAAWGLDR